MPSDAWTKPSNDAAFKADFRSLLELCAPAANPPPEDFARHIHKQYSAEEKIRLVHDGLRGNTLSFIE